MKTCRKECSYALFWDLIAYPGIRNLKRALVKAYGKLKNNPNPQLEKDYQVLKKSLRRCQRRESYLKELKEVHNLDRVSRIKNKNYFWRFTNKMKKRRSAQKEVTASSTKL